MADQHKEPKTSSRFPPDLKTAALERLHAHGWGLNEYLIACLEMLRQHKSPQELMKFMAQFRPPERRGRPKKTTG